MPEQDKQTAKLEQSTDRELERRALGALPSLLERGAEERAALLASLETSDPKLAARLRELAEARPADLGFSFGEEQARVDQPTEPAVLRPSDAGARTRPQSARHVGAFGYAFLMLAVLGLGLYGWVASVLFRYDSETVPKPFRGSWNGSQIVLTEVSQAGAGAGKLSPGDRILSVNGQSNRLMPFLLWQRPFTKGGSYSLGVLRNGRPSLVTLYPRIQRSQIDVAQQGLFCLISFAFFATALILGFARPPTKVKQLGALALLGEALVLLQVAVGVYVEVLTKTDLFLDRMLLLASGIHFAFAYHFFTTFFDQLRKVRARRFSVACLYVWGLFCGVCLQFSLGAFQTDAVLNHGQLLLLSLILSTSFYFVAPAAICVFVRFSIRRVEDPLERLRAQWIGYGSIVGIVPYVLFKIASTLIARWNLWYLNDLLGVGFAASLLASFAIPICLAYAILKHQVLDIRILTRKSLDNRYFKPSLQVAVVLVIAGIAISVFHYGSITAALLMMAVLASVLVLYDRAGRWLDRYCGRDPVYRAYLLERASTEIRKAVSVEDFSVALEKQVAGLLQAKATYIYLDWEWNGQYRTAADAASAGDKRLGRPDSLFDRLFSDNPPASISLADILSTSHTVSVDDTARQLALAVPMTTRKGRIAGFLFVGERRSSDEYLAADRNLLVDLAESGAAVLEHMQLERQVEQHASESGKFFKECRTCGECVPNEAKDCSSNHEALRPIWSWPRLIEKRYQLKARIGRGGMGVVYRAHDEKLRRDIALKLVEIPDLPGAELRISRALREAQVMARILHPNIVQVYDSGQVDERLVFIAMEFVDGRTLRSLLENRRATRAQAADWFEHLLAGLEVAHRKRIVHRDLKPDNVMVTDEGRLVILDFGVAKFVGAEEATKLTQTGWHPGTLCYMSPEQGEGKEIDARSDLYTVGLMVVEVLTDQCPVSSRQDANEDLCWGSDEVSRELSELLRRCLATDRALRPSSAEELRRELIPCLRSEQTLHAAGSA